MDELAEIHVFVFLLGVSSKTDKSPRNLESGLVLLEVLRHPCEQQLCFHWISSSCLSNQVMLNASGGLVLTFVSSLA